MLFAAATSTGYAVDLHFGQTSTFFIFRKEQGKLTLSEKRSVSPLSAGDPDHPFDRERFEQITEALSGCSKIYCEKIGDKPKRELERLGFEVVDYSGPIKDICD